MLFLKEAHDPFMFLNPSYLQCKAEVGLFNENSEVRFYAFFFCKITILSSFIETVHEHIKDEINHTNHQIHEEFHKASQNLEQQLGNFQLEWIINNKI